MWEIPGRKVYGARKVWQQLNREGIVVARCTVERLMGELGLAGACARRKRPRTTLSGGAGERPADLLERGFDVAAPNRAWVADIERHEALLIREEVQDLLLRPVAAGR